MIARDSGLDQQEPSAGRVLARRRQVRPQDGTRLTVDDPAIDAVFDLETGSVVPSDVVIGTDYAKLIQLRMRVRTQMLRDEPMYRCPHCGVAVHICRSWKEHKFFFKHRHEDGNCPAVTAGKLSQEEINARRYNGVKESRLHIRMKEALTQCLGADPRFSGVRTESAWKGQWTSEWRKPDVQATYDGLRIAFEIQLSTTYLDVIAARRDFYLQQGGLLCWIFARFDTERLRMTEEDVFYNNNFNAFVVNAHTVQASLAAGAFQLECIWSTPMKDGGVSCLRRQVISFDQLTLDLASQRAYFFDFEGARRARSAAADAAHDALRKDFEAAFCGGTFYGTDGESVWDGLRARFARAGTQLPRRRMDMPYTLIQAMYSAKAGKPVASQKKRLVEIAHNVATGGRQHLRWFGRALRHWQRGPQLTAEDRTGLWAKKVRACKADEAVDPAAYMPDRTHQRLIEFLFPELGSLN